MKTILAMEMGSGFLLFGKLAWLKEIGMSAIANDFRQVAAIVFFGASAMLLVDGADWMFRLFGGLFDSEKKLRRRLHRSAAKAILFQAPRSTFWRN
jgi:hypothetical protein